MPEIIIFNDCNGPLGFGRYAGPYRIATELRDNGFTVQVIEFFGDMSPDEVESVIDAKVTKETLWVGFASTLLSKHLTHEEELEMWLTPPMGNPGQLGEIWTTLFPHTDQQMSGFLDKIKTINPKCKIVVGGYKALVKEFTGVDYWILGQGEEAAIAVSKHLKYGTELNTLQIEGSNVITDKMYEYKDFNNSKIKWHKSDLLTPGEHLPIETARGCIFKCAFCAYNLNGKKFGDYTKNAYTLREELLYNYEHFGTTDYMVSDDTINDSLTKVQFLHNVITSLPFKVSISGYLRVDIIAAQTEMIRLLYEMGLSSANFGIETFNKKAGSLIGKGADPGLIKETLFRLKDEWKDDVFTSGNFIVGLPGESKESVKETFEWLHRPDLPLHAIGATRLYVKQYNRSITPVNISDENMIKYGFRKLNDGWMYNNSSKILDDSKKYDIDINYLDGMTWSSSYMTAYEAEQLVADFYADPRNSHKKFSLTGFVVYNRMRNLGYSKEKIAHMCSDDPKILVEAVNLRRNLKDQYMRKLLINKV